jgi:hypothetical protein
MKDARPIIKQLARKNAGPIALSWRACFVFSAGAILALAGADMVLDVFERSQVLNLRDPLTGVAFRYLLLFAGAAELLVSYICLFTDKETLSVGVLAWLVSSLGVYRVGIWTMGWHHPWVFVGRLTNVLNISPLLADGFILGAALYLLTGSLMLILSPQKTAGV